MAKNHISRRMALWSRAIEPTGDGAPWLDGGASASGASPVMWVIRAMRAPASVGGTVAHDAPCHPRQRQSVAESSATRIRTLEARHGAHRIPAMRPLPDTASSGAERQHPWGDLQLRAD